MINNILQAKDIKLHTMASTYTLPLFWYGSRLFRSYITDEADRFKKILSFNLSELQPATKTAFLLDLNELSNLINHDRLSGAQLDGYSLVYEHKNYMHRVRIQETVPALAKRFISTICDMNYKLIQSDMIVVDTNESNINITIDGIKWLDYGSIKNIDDGYQYLQSFMEIGYLIGKYLLKKYYEIYDRITVEIVRTFDADLTKISEMDLSKPEAWLKLKEWVNSYPIPDLQSTHWADEYSLVSDINDPENYNDKSKGYWKLLQEIEFETVTDIACNKGYFSFLAAKKAKSVIGFDIDQKCILKAYEMNEQFKLPAIFAVKTVEEIIANDNYETSRFKSDLVVALAIVHHIKVKASEFVKMIDSICNKYVIIEDINDAIGYEKLFVEQGYELVKRIDSTPLPRTLSLYRKT